MSAVVETAVCFQQSHCRTLWLRYICNVNTCFTHLPVYSSHVITFAPCGVVWARIVCFVPCYSQRRSLGNLTVRSCCHIITFTDAHNTSQVHPGYGPVVGRASHPNAPRNSARQLVADASVQIEDERGDQRAREHESAESCEQYSLGIIATRNIISKTATSSAPL